MQVGGKEALFSMDLGGSLPVILFAQGHGSQFVEVEHVTDSNKSPAPTSYLSIWEKLHQQVQE